MTVDHETQDQVLLTLEDVRQWRVQRDAVAADLVTAEESVEKLKDALDDLERRIAFADSLLHVGPKAEVRKTDSRSGGFIAFVESLLDGKGAGLTYKSLGLLIENDPKYKDQFKRNPNVLYNSIARLDERGVVVRIGKRIFHKESYDILKNLGIDPIEHGEADENEVRSGPDCVTDIVKAHPNGISTSGILKEMRKTSEMAGKLERNPQYGYTVISRMAKRRQLERRGDLYVLGPEADDKKTDVFG